MKTCDALHRLITLQGRIVACLGETTSLVRTRGVAACNELAQRRWETMRLLREYQLFKHHEIFDPAIASGDRARIIAATAMKERCVAAGDDFAAHVRRWSGTALERDWAAYEAALLRMTGAIGRHVVRERREVEALLRGTVTTRERVAARPVLTK